MNAPESASANLSEVSEIADITHRAAEAQERLKHIAATATSADGAVTVTVNTSGALQQLAFGPRAQELPLPRLAAAVVATAQRAQVQAAQQLKVVMAPLIGTDSPAMKFLSEQIPAPEIAEEQPPGTPQWELNTEQSESPAPPAATPAPPAPPRPTRPRPGDDDDYDDGPILRRGF
jgi:DNA-binding protein YbaB